MWVKLLQPVTGLFFPSETLPAGAVISISGPRGNKLVGQGKAIQTVFPSGGDPDDVEEKRDKYRKANGGRPLWDERQRDRKHTANALETKIQNVLARRSAAAWFERVKAPG